MVKDIRKVKFLLPLSVILICCAGEPVFDRVESIPSEGWGIDNIISFEFPISDTNQLYDILIHTRNLQNYSYSNIWLFIDITAPNSFTKRDTFEIMLADDAGRWYGKGIGNINTMLVPYKEGAKFSISGVYKMTLQHAMRDEVLENIMDVGIRIQKHQPK